jgi:hypothetical protein
MVVDGDIDRPPTTSSMSDSTLYSVLEAGGAIAVHDDVLVGRWSAWVATSVLEMPLVVSMWSRVDGGSTHLLLTLRSTNYTTL